MMSSSAAAGFLNGETVTVKQKYVSGEDDYGNDVHSYKTIQVTGCSVQQASSSEDVNFTDQTITNITVYMPYGTDVEYIDSMIVDGVEYEVTGKPESFKSPFTANIAPIAVRGTRVEGASS